MDLRELINAATASIVDVRTPGEFMMGNVEGSINIPLNEVPERIEEFMTMSKPLVLCCASGGRSGQAAGFLENQGVDQVHNGGGWNMVQMHKM